MLPDHDRISAVYLNTGVRKTGIWCAMHTVRLSIRRSCALRRLPCTILIRKLMPTSQHLACEQVGLLLFDIAQIDRRFVAV